ncbi:MAG: DUF4886 domain-containing protein [Clostridia bacterium]|nr:DUF4886 domain-containing protein [Clostridia bacterium]
MKAIRVLFSILLALLGMMLLTACGGNPTGNPTGDPAGDDTPPNDPIVYTLSLEGGRTEFSYLEAFSADGLVVYRTGGDENNGSQVALSADEYRVNADSYNANLVGTYTITVEDLSGLADPITYEVTVSPRDSLRLLILGNSFGDDAMAHLYKTALSAGIPAENICLANLYIGGCTLQQHLTNIEGGAAAYEFHLFGEGGTTTETNYTVDMGLAYAEWDFVMLQQASHESGKPLTYAPLDALMAYVREKVPEAELAFQMTWAYQQDSTHGGFAAYERDQIEMYESILLAVSDQVLTRDFAVLVPSGTAIQNARTSFLGDTLTRDGYHLSLNYGRYIASLTTLGALTGIDPMEVSYAPLGLWGDHITVCRESARNAILCDWDVTASSYTKEPVLDLSIEDYTKLELDFTVGKYWHSMAAGSHNVLNGSGDFGMKFAATKRFTSDELPADTILIIADGWKIRPEAWKDAALQESRPDEIGAGTIVLDESFFDGYLYRAFNVSRTDGQLLTNYKDMLNEVFCIYVPNEAANQM